MKPLLTIDHPAMQLGNKKLVADIALEVLPSQLICITGESGCGKTSLLRAILGFVPLSGGKISPLPGQIRQITAYVPQELNPPVEYVRDMISLPFSLNINRQLKFAKEQMLRLWNELALPPALYDQRVNELSGGQRARINLATALMLNKPLLIADEPTAALDAETSNRVAQLLRRHVEQTDTAAIIVSHDPHFARLSTTYTLPWTSRSYN